MRQPAHRQKISVSRQRPRHNATVAYVFKYECRNQFHTPRRKANLCEFYSLRAFVMLLGRVLPLQYESRSDMRAEVTYRSVAEVRKELEARGISIEAVKRVLHQPMEKVDNLRVSTEIEDE